MLHVQCCPPKDRNTLMLTIPPMLHVQCCPPKDRNTLMLTTPRVGLVLARTFMISSSIRTYTPELDSSSMAIGSPAILLGGFSKVNTLDVGDIFRFNLPLKSSG